MSNSNKVTTLSPHRMSEVSVVKKDNIANKQVVIPVKTVGGGDNFTEINVLLKYKSNYRVFKKKGYSRKTMFTIINCGLFIQFWLSY